MASGAMPPSPLGLQYEVPKILPRGHGLVGAWIRCKWKVGGIGTIHTRVEAFYPISQTYKIGDETGQESVRLHGPSSIPFELITPPPWFAMRAQRCLGDCGICQDNTTVKQVQSTACCGKMICSDCFTAIELGRKEYSRSIALCPPPSGRACPFCQSCGSEAEAFDSAAATNGFSVAYYTLRGRERPPQLPPPPTSAPRVILRLREPAPEPMLPAELKQEEPLQQPSSSPASAAAFKGAWLCTAAGCGRINDPSADLCEREGCRRKASLFGVSLASSSRKDSKAAAPQLSLPPDAIPAQVTPNVRFKQRKATSKVASRSRGGRSRRAPSGSRGPYAAAAAVGETANVAAVLQQMSLLAPATAGCSDEEDITGNESDARGSEADDEEEEEAWEEDLENGWEEALEEEWANATHGLIKIARDATQLGEEASDIAPTGVPPSDAPAAEPPMCGLESMLSPSAFAALAAIQWPEESLVVAAGIIEAVSEAEQTHAGSDDVPSLYSSGGRRKASGRRSCLGGGDVLHAGSGGGSSGSSGNSPGTWRSADASAAPSRRNSKDLGKENSVPGLQSFGALRSSLHEMGSLPAAYSAITVAAREAVLHGEEIGGDDKGNSS